MNQYTLMLYDWESKVEWFFTHKENKSRGEFNANVEYLITKYKDEYFELNKNKSVDGYGLIKFITTKLPELGYSKVTPVVCSYEEDNIQDLKDKFSSLRFDYMVRLQEKRKNKL